MNPRFVDPKRLSHPLSTLVSFGGVRVRTDKSKVERGEEGRCHCLTWVGLPSGPSSETQSQVREFHVGSLSVETVMVNDEILLWWRGRRRDSRRSEPRSGDLEICAQW